MWIFILNPIDKLSVHFIVRRGIIKYYKGWKVMDICNMIFPVSLHKDPSHGE